MSDYERPLPEEHEAKIRNILQIPEAQSIPEHIKDLYWDIARTARKLGFAAGDNELLLLVILLNRPVQDRPVSFLETVSEKDVKPDTLVLAKYRNRWRYGNYKRLKGDRVIVVLADDTGEEREFQATGVRFPTSEEATAAAALV